MPSKSCELDYMGTDKIKEILHTCIQSITKIVNLSLNKGTFSNQWKTAIVKPLIKHKKKGTAYTNYRPLSNMSFISKVVERCTLQQLTQHCNINTLLPDFQSAYWKHHGCEISQPPEANKWHSKGHGKPAGNGHDHSRSQCHLQHCQPWAAATSVQSQIQSDRHGSRLVQELPDSKKIQSLNKWNLLKWENHELQCTPRICTRSLLLHSICIHNTRCLEKRSDPNMICWWLFNM